MARLCLYAAAVVVVAACLMGARGAWADTDDVIDLNDANLSVPELIAKYNYPVEVHTVTTSDSYILEMHRIPHGRDRNADTGPGKPAVLVTHGLMSSSADFVISGPSKALAYSLAESGLDVWLGNLRGNYYSRRHISLDPERNPFWNFSFEENGTEDLTTMINYILGVTGLPTLSYIGHSMGTTSFFALNSLKPEYNGKIRSAHLLAPIASLTNIDAPTLSAVANFANELLIAGTLLGKTELLPRGTLTMVNGQPGYDGSHIITRLLAEAFVSIIDDESPEQFDQDMMPVWIGHTPAGASLKQVAHYAQMMAKKNFCSWDFGPFENFIRYRRISPPCYPLEVITVPINMWYSLGSDVLTSEQDVMNTHARLPSSVLRPVSNFSHFDFAWGLLAKERIYDEVIASIWQTELQSQ